MKKILVPVDFSDQSAYATKLAAIIAKKSNSEIHLLHMVELPSGIVDMAAGSNFSIPESMMYLRKVRRKLLHFKEYYFSENTHVIHSIRFQNASEGILDYSEKNNMNLIVMGSKGHSDFEEILIGSNTEKVVRTSKAPVIVVKKDTKDFHLDNLVFASSFKEDNKAAFANLLDFASKFNSTIHLLKVNTAHNFESDHDAKEKIKAFLTDFSALPEHTINVFNDISVEKGILNFSNEIQADIIALTTHGRSGLSRLFNSSIAKNLTSYVMRPMLTFKV